MQYKKLYWFMKRQRRRIVKNCFDNFFEDVDIQFPPGELRRYDLIVSCKKIRIRKHMIQEAQFNKGFGSELEAAFTISHLAHAYLNQFGATVATPLMEDGAFIFWVTSIYYRRVGG